MIDIDDNEEEELYFTPVSSANLASLFNASMVQPPDSSLTYKPPKQPCAKTESQDTNIMSKNTKSRQQCSMLFFKEVHVFQLLNKEHSPAGRCGLALIGNEQISFYKLLLYKQRNNILSTTKITENFEFHKQKNNYITIKDDQKLTWTINFNNESDLNEFSNIICAKCGCKELSTTENESKSSEKSGMKLETSINNLEASNREQPNNLSFNSIESELIKPEEKLLDPHEILTTNRKQKGPEILPRLTDKTEMGPKNIDSDASDSSEANKKADILLRISKMGKKILNKTVNDVSDSSDLEELNTESQKMQSGDKRNLPFVDTRKENKSRNSAVIPKSHDQQSIKSSVSENYIQLQSTLNQMMPFQNDVSQRLYSPTQLTPEQLNMYFIENRTHNSEVRMNIMKLQNSLDEMANQLKKTGLGHYENCSQTSFQSLNDLMEENKKLKRIIEENDKSMFSLKSSYESCKKKNDELMRKETEHSYEIASLTQETARCTYEEHKLNLKIKEQQAHLQTQATKLAECEEKLNAMTAAYSDCVHIKKEKLPEIKATIKSQMNLLYTEVTGNFKSDSTYDGNNINKILAPSIIDNTYKILHIINEMFM